MVVGVDGDAAREVARGEPRRCRGARRSRRSTSCSPRPAGATTTTASATRARASSTRSCSKKGDGRARLPAAGRQLPALGRRPLLPQPELREPHRHRQAAAAAVARHRRGARALRARRVDLGLGGQRRAASEPDVVLGVRRRHRRRWRRVAAAWWLREHAPELRVRVVNVVDLDDAVLAARAPARHGRRRVRRAFTRDVDVVFAFHGYPARDPPAPPRRARTPSASTCAATSEEGTTTTPFDMVVLNETSRYHLAMDALRRRAGGRPRRATELNAQCQATLAAAPRLRRASTSRTCRRSATGCGATSVVRGSPARR